MAVQLKTGIGRFFADLKKSPYRTLFNPSVSGARAFNATVTHRAIEKWIESKKKATKKSGAAWGVLVHGNRISASVIFGKHGEAKLTQPIQAYTAAFAEPELHSLCEDVYEKMVSAINTHYPGKLLAALFKNPTMSKHVFDLASK